MAEALKVKARDEIVRIYGENNPQQFSQLGDKQKSIRLARFYVEHIHNKTNYEISDEDVEQGIVDGAKDLGCDFIYRGDGHVLIIQAKYRKAGTNESAEEISHFREVLTRLHSPTVHANKFLEEFRAEIDWARDSFELVYITFGQIKMESQAQKIIDLPNHYPIAVEGLDERCEWSYLGEEDLNALLRSARDLMRGISDKEITLHPSGEKGGRGKDSIIATTSGDYKSFIMTLDARQLEIAYFNLNRDAVFSLNIRNYIGNTATNKEIINSAERDPAHFYLFNNGISCLATKVDVLENSVKIRGLQIINGAQTVRALVKVARSIKVRKENFWNISVPKVLVRITEIPEGYSSAGRMKEKITEYNNTQNAVKISDFRSNDPVHESLRELFAYTSRNGNKVVYLSKRTDTAKSNTEVVKLDEFSKAVYTFLHEFISFSGSSTFLFDDGPNGGYVHVFGDGNKIWERMPESEFRFRASIYWLSSEITKYMRETRVTEIDADAKASLERKWPVIFGCAIVAKFVYKELWKEQISHLYKGDWSIGNGPKGQAVLWIYNAAKAGVVTTYRNAKQNDPKFVHRNWMRARSTPDDIKKILEQVVLPIHAPLAPKISK